MLIGNSSVEIEKLVKQGLSLVPAKGKDACIKGGTSNEWFSGLFKHGTLELFDSMDYYKTEDVCIVCGVNGLVCIDIDTKHYEGFDAIIFRDIKEIYPELWEKFRVEQTPTGGYHLYYFIEGKTIVESSQPAWIEKNVEGKKKEQCFLEIRAKNNFTKCYPSFGYILIRGENIPTFTTPEHNSIVNLCKSYNEWIREKIEYIKPSKNEGSIYNDGDNPFECFDNSGDGEMLLVEEFGWKLLDKKIGGKLAFVEPGKGNSKHAGAVFDLVKRVFKIYTTDGGIDTGWYRPTGLLNKIKYKGDKSQLFHELVGRGYGKIKRSVERNIIKKSAKKGIDPPKNVSNEGLVEYKEEILRLKTTYPHGIFWDVKTGETGETTINISQKGIDDVIKSMGYKWHNGKIYLVSEDLIFLKTVNEGEIFHSLLMYINESEEELNRKIYDAYSKFVVTFSSLTIKRIKEFCKLEVERILESTKFTSYKFYKNCYLTIDKEGWVHQEYKDIGDKLIFEDNIIQRNYIEVDNGDFKKSKIYEFLDKAIGVNKNLFETIGYLCHDFIDDSMNAIIVASEKCSNPKKGGGSGKNLLFNLLNHATSVHVIDGRQLELKNSLLQSFNGERILVLSDVEEKFDYSFFKNFSSGASSLKKLYQDVVVLKRKQMPKPVILTNFSYEITSGLERRIIPIEFTEFFSRIRGGVATHFGCMFPSYDEKGDWTEEDWNFFDALIINCIWYFLKATQLIPIQLSTTGWEKQFIQVHKEQTYQFIKENIDKFIQLGRVDTRTFDDKYEEFCKENKIRENYRKTAIGLNSAIEDYCHHVGINFQKNQTWKQGGIAFKGRIFGEIKEEEKFDLF